MQEVFKKDFHNGINLTKFHSRNTILSVGFENGEIKLFKIYIRETSNISKNLVDEISSLKPHTKPIISIELDFNLGYIFSIAKDSQLTISEFNYQTTIKTLVISSTGLCAMHYDEKNNLIIVSDNLGSLYFYSVSSPINPIKLQAIHSQFKPINLVKLYKEKMFLGTISGDLYIFKIEIGGDGLHMLQEYTISTNESLKIINAYYSRDYIIVGLSNGTISIYTKNNEYPECKYFLKLFLFLLKLLYHSIH